MVEGAVVIGRRLGSLRMAAQVAAGLSAADGVKQLRGRRRLGADDVQFAAAPMRRHLAAAAGGVSSCAD